ncbi:MAG TPA: tetratricopeptide repeat protein [Polyangia bacterium]
MSRFGAAMMIVLGTAGVASADFAAPRYVPERSSMAVRAANLVTAAAKAEMIGNASEGLRLADAAIKADPDDGWGYYDRGEALQALGQTDGAISAYREAEKHFPNEVWSKSIPLYGEANALAVAGRCDEARVAFERYASFVESADPRSAELGRRYAKDCRARS